MFICFVFVYSHDFICVFVYMYRCGFVDVSVLVKRLYVRACVCSLSWRFANVMVTIYQSDIIATDPLLIYIYSTSYTGTKNSECVCTGNCTNDNDNDNNRDYQRASLVRSHRSFIQLGRASSRTRMVPPFPITVITIIFIVNIIIITNITANRPRLSYSL